MRLIVINELFEWLKENPKMKMAVIYSLSFFIPLFLVIYFKINFLLSARIYIYDRLLDYHQQAVIDYRDDTGIFPEKLTDLTQKNNNKGPWLYFVLDKDKYGNFISYDNQSGVIRSAGRDGAFDTKDDEISKSGIVLYQQYQLKQNSLNFKMTSQ